VDKTNLVWEIYGFGGASANDELYVEGLIKTPTDKNTPTFSAKVTTYYEKPKDFAAPNTGTKTRIIEQKANINLAAQTDMGAAPKVLFQPEEFNI
jgi:hypothetical protein